MRKKLTKFQQEALRNDFESGAYTQTELGEIYNVSQSSVSKTLRNTAEGGQRINNTFNNCNFIINEDKAVNSFGHSEGSKWRQFQEYEKNKNDDTCYIDI